MEIKSYTSLTVILFPIKKWYSRKYRYYRYNTERESDFLFKINIRTNQIFKISRGGCGWSRTTLDHFQHQHQRTMAAVRTRKEMNNMGDADYHKWSDPE